MSPQQSEKLLQSAVKRAIAPEPHDVTLSAALVPPADAGALRSAYGTFVPILPAALRVAITDCGGHPRVLEFLLRAALKPALLPADGVAAGVVTWLMSLRDDVCSQSNQATVPQAPPLWALVVALMGQPLRLDEPVPGSRSRQPFSHHIAHNVFTTSYTNDAEAVPTLSMMQIWAAVKQGIKFSPLAVALGHLLQADSAALTKGLPGVGFMGSTPFEHFVARWLQVRFALAALAAVPPAVSLEEIFRVSYARDARSSGVLPGWVGMRFPIPADPSGPSTEPPPMFVHTEHIYAGNGVPDIQAWGGEEKLGQGGIHCFAEKTSNAGFNLLVLAARGENRAGFAVETKFQAWQSQAAVGSSSSGMMLDAARVSRQAALLSRYDALFAGVGVVDLRKPDVAPPDLAVSQCRIPLVLMTWHDVTLTAHEVGAFQKGNVLVLDRSAVEKAVGPTLAGRAWFVMDMSAAIANARVNTSRPAPC